MRFVWISDALEVARLHKGARRRNIAKTPKPPGQQQSWDEMSRPKPYERELSARANAEPRRYP